MAVQLKWPVLGVVVSIYERILRSSVGLDLYC